VAPPEYIASWRELLAEAIPVADSAAPLQLVEFIDLECPACKSFQTALRRVREQNPQRVAVYFLHYPLPQHRFARPAARAAECAFAEGRFSAFSELVLLKQDSLGLKSWSSFAKEAGISAIARFERCTSKSEPIPRVEAGLALGSKFGVHATPTIILSGWRFPSTPTVSDLQGAVDALLEGRVPVPNAGKLLR
jgi:protein-disulfide isomerase